MQEKLFKPVKFTLYFMESFQAKIGHRILVCQDSTQGYQCWLASHGPR